MVIFGAGASYDSFSEYPPESGAAMDQRPPLANQLFELRFATTLDQFPQCGPIVPYLRPGGGNAAPNVEQVLEKYQKQATVDPERNIQLAAIRYYLQTMLRNCQSQWKQITHGVTNYGTLLDHVRHRRKPHQKVWLVTFNYDTLLEEALPVVRVKTNEIKDYIATDYQVIKLHGSINWGHEVKNPILNVETLNELQIATELIDMASTLVLEESYHIIQKPPSGIRRLGSQPKLESRPLFPALPIPVENKSEYECPQEHYQLMEKYLPSITDMLLIGWRASEKRFLTSLADSIQKDTRIMVISSGEPKAIEAINRMKQANVPGDFIPAKGGFSNSILSGEIESFLENWE